MRIMTITLTESNFDKEVKQASVPVLVNFCQNTNLCVPDYKCCNVDAKASARLAREYRIRNLPTILLFNNGNVTDTIVGEMHEKQLMKILGSELR